MHAHLSALQEMRISSQLIVTHDTVRECVPLGLNYIQCNTSRVLLIINGTFGEDTAKIVHTDHQVEVIYVYCMNIDFLKKEMGDPS